MRLLAVPAIALLSSCATVPLTGVEDDARGKEFTPAPGKANIYVFRSQSLAAARTIEIALDGRTAGKTAPQTYFLFEVSPGPHELISMSENTSTLQVNAQAGQNYFVWQAIGMGVFSPRSDLQLVDEATGQSSVNDCYRVQAPF